MTAGHVRKKSLSDLAYDELRREVLSGRLRADERISVVALAERMHMSRSPVRAAVERLVVEGLLDLHQHGVRSVQPEAAELVHILQVGSVLEGLATRLAAARVGPDVLHSLEKMDRAFERAVAEVDLAEVVPVDLKFHATILENCGNPYLIETLGRIQARIAMGMHRFRWSPRSRHAVQEHGAILRALTIGDSAGAEYAARSHLECQMQRVRLASPECFPED